MKLPRDSRQTLRLWPGVEAFLRSAVWWSSRTAFCWFLLSSGVEAETLRVTSWNLGVDPGNESPSALIGEVAATVRQLGPDVILLQGVQDWHMCQQLIQALQPLEYNVVVCSAFERESPVLPAKPQVAILSRQKAYFAWSEAWPPQKPQNFSGGMAFAAIQAGTQRLGFFTALFADCKSREDSAQWLMSEVQSIGQWETNQVQTFVFGGSGEGIANRSARALRRASSALERAGFVAATESMPADVRGTLRPKPGEAAVVADCLFAGPLGFPSNPRITVSAVSSHYPVTSDIELDPQKVTMALDIRAEERRQKAAQTTELIRTVGYWAASGLGLGLAGWLVLRKLARKRARRIAAARNRLPVRLVPRENPSPLRPVILTTSPDKEAKPERPVSPKPPKPVLRLQPSTRSVAELLPGSTEVLPQPQVEPSRPTKPEGPVALRQPVVATEPAVVTRDEHDPVRQGVIRELSTWLKQKLLRKLFSDRAQMMQAQQIASHMATTLDNRLARIEAQIQQQNQAYVRRIEELNKELAAAREENRELIRERIAQVKAEMEAARARVLAEADLDKNSFRL